MLELHQNATDKVIPFLMVSSADHIAGATGLAPTVEICKDGGGFGAPAGVVSELAHGWYKLTPAAADTNTTGALLLHASAAGADPSDKEVLVVAVDPYDAPGGGMSRLDAPVTSRAEPGDAMSLDLSQAVPTTNADQTVGDALNAARAEGFGKWVQTGTTLTIFAADGVTVVRVFTLNDPVDPTERV